MYNVYTIYQSVNKCGISKKFLKKFLICLPNINESLIEIFKNLRLFYFEQTQFLVNATEAPLEFVYSKTLTNFCEDNG